MKILIIGLDGGTWKILDPAIKSGFMPFFEKLVKQGTKGVLLSTKPPITPAAWASFQMGIGPGGHGIIDFGRWDEKREATSLVNSTFLKNTLWDRAGKKGKKVGVVNVPLTFPPRPLNGYLITGFLTPSLESEFTYPANLKDELLASLPEYEILSLGEIERVKKESKGPFLAKMRELISLRTKAAQFLLRKDDFDLFMVHFQAVDILQHPLWPFLDPTHKSFDSRKQREIFKNFYSPLDKAVEEVSQDFEIILILSDHGFQTHQKRFMLGNFLFQHGFIDRKGRTKKRLNKLIRGFGFNFHFRDKSHLIVMGRSGWGTIWINSKLKIQKTKLKEAIQNLLLTIKDPENKKRPIRKVWEREELYSGEKLHLLPEFLVEPRDGYSLTAAIDPKKGLFQAVRPGVDFHLGIHHEEGIIICSKKETLPKRIEAVAAWVLERL
jgi:predicted AlkP superfamily phosphohydrolase/phosphomutase